MLNTLTPSARPLKYPHRGEPFDQQAHIAPCRLIIAPSGSKPASAPRNALSGGHLPARQAVTPLPVKRQHGATVSVLWRMGSHHPWFERFDRPCGRIYRIVQRPPLPEVLNGWRSIPGHLSLNITEAVHKECLASASAPHGAAVLAAHREHWHINSCFF